MLVYLAKITAAAEKRNAELAAAKAEQERSPAATLRGRFDRWYAEQPAVSRERPYSMSELEKALKTQGRYISPVLVASGWRRGRKWTSRSHYLRFWLPPAAL